MLFFFVASSVCDFFHGWVRCDGNGATDMCTTQNFSTAFIYMQWKKQKVYNSNYDDNVSAKAPERMGGMGDEKS